MRSSWIPSLGWGIASFLFGSPCAAEEPARRAIVVQAPPEESWPDAENRILSELSLAGWAIERSPEAVSAEGFVTQAANEGWQVAIAVRVKGSGGSAELYVGRTDEGTTTHKVLRAPQADAENAEIIALRLLEALLAELDDRPREVKPAEEPSSPIEHPTPSAPRGRLQLELGAALVLPRWKWGLQAGPEVRLSYTPAGVWSVHAMGGTSIVSSSLQVDRGEVQIRTSVAELAVAGMWPEGATSQAGLSLAGGGMWVAAEGRPASGGLWEGAADKAWVPTATIRLHLRRSFHRAWFFGGELGARAYVTPLRLAESQSPLLGAATPGVVAGIHVGVRP